jgi:hypothetical protein
MRVTAPPSDYVRRTRRFVLVAGEVTDARSALAIEYAQWTIRAAGSKGAVHDGRPGTPESSTSRDEGYATNAPGTDETIPSARRAVSFWFYIGAPATEDAVRALALEERVIPRPEVGAMVVPTTSTLEHCGASDSFRSRSSGFGAPACGYVDFSKLYGGCVVGYVGSNPELVQDAGLYVLYTARDAPEHPTSELNGTTVDGMRSYVPTALLEPAVVDAMVDLCARVFEVTTPFDYDAVARCVMTVMLCGTTYEEGAAAPTTVTSLVEAAPAGGGARADGSAALAPGDTTRLTEVCDELRAIGMDADAARRLYAIHPDQERPITAAFGDIRKRMVSYAADSNHGPRERLAVRVSDGAFDAKKNGRFMYARAEGSYLAYITTTADRAHGDGFASALVVIGDRPDEADRSRLDAALLARKAGSRALSTVGLGVATGEHVMRPGAKHGPFTRAFKYGGNDAAVRLSLADGLHRRALLVAGRADLLPPGPGPGPTATSFGVRPRPRAFI